MEVVDVVLVQPFQGFGPEVFGQVLEAFDIEER
jgi:hypothetical protein